MIYVTATDSFLSNLEVYNNKINKIVIEVANNEQAEKTCKKLKTKFEMKNINVSNNKPSYDLNKYYVSYYTVNDKTWK